MKREDVKNKIPGITDEQLNWIMQENGDRKSTRLNSSHASKSRMPSSA